MYRFGDALRQAAIINFEPTWQANLYAVMQYSAALSTCRRALICRSQSSLNPFYVLLNCEDKVKVTNRHGLQCPDVGAVSLFGTVFCVLSASATTGKLHAYKCVFTSAESL